MVKISDHADRFTSMDQRGHILLRPTSYLGPNKFEISDQKVYVPVATPVEDDGQVAKPSTSTGEARPIIEYRKINYMPLMERCFLEITTNAADNRTQTAKALHELKNLKRPPTTAELAKAKIDLDELYALRDSAQTQAELGNICRKLVAGYDAVHKLGQFSQEDYDRSNAGILADLKGLMMKRDPSYDQYGIVNGIAALPEGDDLDDLIASLAELCQSEIRSKKPSRADVIAAGVKPGDIDVYISPTTITVKNYGRPLPTGYHDNGKRIPEFIFGQCLSGSNYGEEVTGAGTNGIGAKAVNVWSTRFSVYIEDAEAGVTYDQTWRNNMSVCEKPIIGKHHGEISSVTMSYELDFARLGVDGYEEDMQALFMRHCADLSFTSDCVVTVSTPSPVPGDEAPKEYEFDYRGSQYVKLYDQNVQVDDVFSHVVADEAGNSSYVLYVMDTPDAGMHQSFVNGLPTYNGGAHVAAAYEEFGRQLVDSINEKSMKKLGKSGTKLTAAQLKSYKITIADIKRHFAVLLAVRVVSPVFDSQSKTKLGGTFAQVPIDAKKIKALFKYSAYHRLMDEIDSKQLKKLKKHDGKKVRHIYSKKCVDANKAGTKDSHLCDLMIAEGDSATAHLDDLVGLAPTKRDYLGILPIKGKSLNTMKATPERINGNVEILQLFEVIGLKYDKDYSTAKARKTLRYGTVTIAADADDDGQHITGLVLLIFYQLFPSLLVTNEECPNSFIRGYITPILKVKVPRTVSPTGKPETKRFYTKGEYDAWATGLTEEDLGKCTETYFKGLSSSSSEDIVECYNDMHLVDYRVDDTIDQYMHLAFDPKLSDERKRWIRNYVYEPVEFMKVMGISHFIKHELIRFSMADLSRSVPNLMDGMKVSQRKVVHGANCLWVGKKARSDIKTSEAASAIGGLTKYHHGDGILASVITRMAQTYTGSNNIAFFEERAKFGTRYKGGKDAGNPRYTKTRPSLISKLIFRPEDKGILKMTYDEGEYAEPETFYPIIPMLLVNSNIGIGTGYSSSTPNYNPLDLIDWLYTRLTGGENVHELVPWYPHFTGDIVLIDRQRNVKAKPESAYMPVALREANAAFAYDDMCDPDEYVEDDEGSCSKIIRHGVRTYGRYHTDSNGTIYITELPIGQVPFTYRHWLDELVKEKKIDTYVDNGQGNKVDFTIKGWPKDRPHSLKILGLVRNMSLTNMTALVEGRPYRFKSVESMMETFYTLRLRAYEKRREYEINRMQQEIDHKRRLRAVVEVFATEKVALAKRSTAAIIADLDALGLDSSLFSKLSLNCVTLEEVARLQDLIDKKVAAREEYEKQSAADIWIDELVELNEKLGADPIYRTN